MKLRIQTVLLVMALTLGAPNSFAKGEGKTDAQVRQMMIDESRRSYSGSCPCPYDRASNGSKCGKRSAYSKPGGAEPLCYANDISDEMVSRWRRG